MLAPAQKTPCRQKWQQGAKKHSKQLSVSFIRTIPSAPDLHRISSHLDGWSRAYGTMPLTAGGELHPALKQTFYLHSIPQVLQNARGCGIIADKSPIYHLNWRHL